MYAAGGAMGGVDDVLVLHTPQACRPVSLVPSDPPPPPQQKEVSCVSVFPHVSNLVLFYLGKLA